MIMTMMAGTVTAVEIQAEINMKNVPEFGDIFIWLS